MARKRGKLSPEEQALWAQVTRTIVPLHPADKPSPPADQLAADAPPSAKAARKAQAGSRAPVMNLAPIPARQVLPRAGAVSHDLAPSPAQRLAGQPLRMDHKTHRQMTQGKLRPDARIDLHGMTLATAQPVLTSFLLSAHTRGCRLVLVITGKGKPGDPYAPLPVRPGALRHNVPHWLAMPPLLSIVLQVTPAHRRHGGEGAYYVYLRRSGQSG